MIQGRRSSLTSPNSSSTSRRRRANSWKYAGRFRHRRNRTRYGCWLSGGHSSTTPTLPGGLNCWPPGSTLAAFSTTWVPAGMTKPGSSLRKECSSTDMMLLALGPTFRFLRLGTYCRFHGWPPLSWLWCHPLSSIPTGRSRTNGEAVRNRTAPGPDILSRGRFRFTTRPSRPRPQTGRCRRPGRQPRR